MSANARTCAAAAQRGHRCAEAHMRAHTRASSTWTCGAGQWVRLPLCTSGRDSHDPGWGLRDRGGLPALSVQERGFPLEGEHLSPEPEPAAPSPEARAHVHGSRANRKAIRRDGLVSVVLSASVFLGRLKGWGGLPPVSVTCRETFEGVLCGAVAWVDDTQVL